MSKSILSNSENLILNKIAHHRAYNDKAQEMLCSHELSEEEEQKWIEKAKHHGSELRRYRRKRDNIRKKIKRWEDAKKTN
jgi:hypothetical protein